LLYSTDQSQVLHQETDILGPPKSLSTMSSYTSSVCLLIHLSGLLFPLLSLMYQSLPVFIPLLLSLDLIPRSSVWDVSPSHLSLSSYSLALGRAKVTCTFLCPSNLPSDVILPLT
jgi:hypothetical protein